MIECKKCNKKFKNKMAHAGHLAHCGIKKVKCEICEKEMDFWRLKRHSKIHENNVKCTTCEKPFKRNNYLLKHRKNHFCSSSCSAIFNNKLRGKEKFCLNCNKKIFDKKHLKGRKYCNSICQRDYNYKKYIERWKTGLESGKKGNGITLYIRRYLFEKYDEKCSKCGWGEINTHSGKKPLETEHIDGNPYNNKEDNLTLLCPNCHSLTSTSKGLNKGNGRTKRMEAYHKKQQYLKSLQNGG